MPNKPKVKLYHLSTVNLDGRMIFPRVPKNRMVETGAENDITPRISFAPSIDECLMALSADVEGIEFFVHEPVGKFQAFHPSKIDVPDVEYTSEVWVTTPVKLKKVCKIRVLPSDDLPTYDYDFKDFEGHPRTGTVCVWRYEILP